MTSEAITWTYMWSQDYTFFHKYLEDNIKDSRFSLEPQFIDQSEFDKGLYKINGHAWLGCCIKVDFIINLLKTKSATQASSKYPYILFTDVDIIVNPGIYDKLVPYMDEGLSMVFLKEGEHLNIGVMLLKICPEVLEFWELIKAKVIEDPTKLDQAYVNTTVCDYPGKWASFNNKDFTCSNNWDSVTPFYINQALSGNIGKKYHIPEKIFYFAQMGVNMDLYMKYTPEHVVPHIYEFQEMLMRSYKKKGLNVAYDS